MRLLLTGSSGWLGRFLAPRLRAKGHDVTGLDVAPGVNTDAMVFNDTTHPSWPSGHEYLCNVKVAKLAPVIRGP